ncbi:MAG: hypothetical protein A2756_03150 [Candidatus Ryanbacteria bacterium RIFCSPHIGHO2_01_FULL_48_27]|uniref:Type-4 uracil-DNA glycosylase n=1 Tax=Candidatus Ryanbacteria bacterium RIFCSPHIGHO2_01_FULL_48_27 TaxID=1802115 RepID=A0A1G2G7L9_9BACT|nr:MAG: hypothetical protein A2756_03150 [Candidatus Ryanbacteria bacterium RIFCSPHIGHO2_01_FULL_48_27]
MTTKKERLETLKQELEQNRALPLSQTANLVFGEGSEDTAVLFIGEAPGFHEDKQGRPFVGLAGQLLNKLLAEIGWPRESVYITNIVKRRPPENRDPLPEEIEAYKPYLARQIEILEPKLIATLGRFSMNYFLPEAKISRDHGRLTNAGAWFVYPLYHPAAALRATAVLEDLRKDFQRLPEIVERLSSPEIPQSPKEQKPEASQTPLF